MSAALTIAPAESMKSVVITAMRENLASGMSLADMADAVCLSPFHFHRSFRRAMGATPAQYFSALRIDLAKRLLLTSQDPVGDICFDVGFSSPGTFTTRFTELVGAAPRAYRQLPTRVIDNGLWNAVAVSSDRAHPAAQLGAACEIIGPPEFRGAIFVGIFTQAIPQGAPIGGQLLLRPGPFHPPQLPDGQYWLLCAAVPTDHPEWLFLSDAEMLVGMGHAPLQMKNGQPENPIRVSLRRPLLWDPPLVIALGELLRRRASYFLRPAKTAR